MKLKKTLALLCALSMMAMAATACGSDDKDSSKESSTSSSESAKESSKEESSEEESEEEDSDEAESEDESESGDVLNTEASFEDLTFLVSDEWEETNSGGFLMYTLPNQLGYLAIQNVSVDDLDVEVPEDADVSGAMAEEFEQIDTYVSDSMEESGATIVSDEWDQVNGAKAYGVNFTLETSGISTDNYAVYFLVDDVIYAVSICEMEGDTEMLDSFSDFLQSIQF